MINPLHLKTTSRLTRYLLLAAAMLLTGCNSANSIDQISILSEQNANSDFATSLDMVFVYGQTISAQLPLHSPDWFAGREQFLVRYGPGLDLVSLEIPPGFKFEKVRLPPRHEDAIKIFVYARYLHQDGQKRMDVSTFRHLVITLKPGEIQVHEMEDQQRRFNPDIS